MVDWRRGKRGEISCLLWLNIYLTRNVVLYRLQSMTINEAYQSVCLSLYRLSTSQMLMEQCHELPRLLSWALKSKIAGLTQETSWQKQHGVSANSYIYLLKGWAVSLILFNVLVFFFPSPWNIVKQFIKHSKRDFLCISFSYSFLHPSCLFCYRSMWGEMWSSALLVFLPTS